MSGRGVEGMGGGGGRVSGREVEGGEWERGSGGGRGEWGRWRGMEERWREGDGREVEGEVSGGRGEWERGGERGEWERGEGDGRERWRKEGVQGTESEK